MEYVAEIQADLNGYPSSEKLILKQGDEGMRYVIVTLLNNGVPVSVGAEVTPRVAMTKPDGKQILADDNIEVLEDGTLKVKVIAQMTVAAGQGIMEIGLYKQGAHLSTAVFGVYVYPNALSMIKVASSNEYQALIDALAQIAPAIDAEKERQAAEKERIIDEIVRQRQEQKRESLTAAAVEEANFTVRDMVQRRDAGEFDGAKGDTGPQGPQGNQGPKGDKGDRGDSGITVPLSGLFVLSGDEQGNLYAYYTDGSEPPQFETDSEGNIYYTVPN
ncbi:collagen-like protein [Clostridium sp. AF15-17LB]|nr:collagen-like protein [Clostridium sp. AF15-17LB]